MKKVYLETPEEVIKALKEGKVVKAKNVKYRLIDGIICSLNEDDGRTMWTVGNSIFEYEDAYIDEPEPFKIEVGQWYETRDHQKARCYCKGEKYAFFTIDNDCSPWSVYLNGHICEDMEAKLDIIGPWNE